MTSKQWTEEDLAKAVVDWLKGQHWDVYQEVAYRGSIADIVATNGPALWVIECKKVLSMDLVAQAWGWTHDAHLVSIATMKPRQIRKASYFIHHILREHRIGMLHIDQRYDGDPLVETSTEPKMNRPKHSDLRAALCEEQKDFAPAGNARGSRWTPFQETIRKVQACVAEYPGVTFKNLMTHIDHHYASDASARVSLRHWIRAGVIEGIELRQEGRALTLWPAKKVDGPEAIG